MGSDEELRERIRRGITGPLRGLVLSSRFYKLDDVRRILSESGIAGMIEVHLTRQSVPQGAGALIIVKLREDSCERKCGERCGSRETSCFGECFYSCLEALQEMIAEKLGGEE